MTIKLLVVLIVMWLIYDEFDDNDFI